MRWLAISMLTLAACGGSSVLSSVEWAGKWRQPAGFPVGSYMEATLGGSGTTIAGSGTQYREAGTPSTFTVQGTSVPVPGPGFTLTYSDGSTEGFNFGQPDHDHLTLQNSQRTVNLTRQ